MLFLIRKYHISGVFWLGERTEPQIVLLCLPIWCFEKTFTLANAPAMIFLLKGDEFRPTFLSKSYLFF